MRRRPTSTAPSRAAAIPAALAGSIALALAGENAAHAAPPRPTLDALPSAHPLAAPLPRLAAAPAPATHVVESGDTVSSIAARYGLDTNAVLAANGLGWSSIIRPGQSLVLTAPAQAAPAPAPAPAPAVGYEVRAGDTLSGIASAHGVSLDAVLGANGLTRASIIYPGETLQIPSASTAAVGAASTPAPLAPGLDAEQSDNARLIIRIGREMGVPERGILIALGTAMQESWLRNLDWGDRDSLGLFQQRPSTGWGTAEQIRDRDYATRAFFQGVSTDSGTVTLGLFDIPGWEAMPYTDAAQAVQISAYPDRYAQWEQPATVWLSALG